MTNTIGFIGAGNMGGAIIGGLLDSGARKPEAIVVSDPRAEIREDLEQRYPGIRTTAENAGAADAAVLILAVKPQVCETVLNGIRDDLSDSTVLASIAAGVTLDSLSRWCRPGARIVRVMPNAPALVREGMSALSPGVGVTEEELNTVKDIFDSVGRSIVLPESLMDAFTALAGSSPAWVFMFLEALADGAVREGMPRDAAYAVAAQAVLGAAALARDAGTHPGVLKDRVCSPGGTTIEAVATLEDRGFRSALIAAVRDCTRRAEELGGR